MRRWWSRPVRPAEVIEQIRVEAGGGGGAGRALAVDSRVVIDQPTPPGATLMPNGERHWLDRVAALEAARTQSGSDGLRYAVRRGPDGCWVMLPARARPST